MDVRLPDGVHVRVREIFFFQAEDGIRDIGVTGVQTCALPISELYGLPEDALLDMGDFAGAVLKYLRRHPVPRLTIAGGIGKLAKLADGHLDLHSGRSQVSTESLRSEEHTSELQSRQYLVCRLLLDKKKK